MTVKEKQDLLDYLGYSLSNDGIDGPQTQTALKKFQADYGVGEDGLVGAVGGTVPRLRAGNFWNDIRFFRREEFRCQCYKYHSKPLCNGFPYEPEEKLVRVLDRIREKNGRVTIISGVRCEQHNRDVGGVWNSRHRYGCAADIVIDNKTPAQMDAIAGAEGDIAYHYIIKNKDGTPAGDIHVDVVV